MTLSPLPYIPRSEEETRLHGFLVERLQPRAGLPKATLISGPRGAGKRTLLCHVFASDPRFRAYQLADAVTREILTGTSEPNAWLGKVADAALPVVAVAAPISGTVASAALPLVRDRLTGTREVEGVRDAFLEGNGKPLLLVVPGIDPADLEALRFHGHRVQEARDRALPHALVFLDDSPLRLPAEPGAAGVARPGVSPGLAGLRHYLADDGTLEVLPLGGFSEAECRGALLALGLSAEWAHVLFQLSDGGPAELGALWQLLQKHGVIAPAGGGRWKAVRSGTAGVGWEVVRDAVTALVQPRMPRPTEDSTRLVDALFLAASMGSTFLPQAVAECMMEVDPKRAELDTAAWEDLWYDVLEYEDPEHSALAVQCAGEQGPGVLQADQRQCFVCAFRDSSLVNLLRASARQMWRDRKEVFPGDRPHAGLVVRSEALDAWLGRTFQETWPRALAFRAALLRVRGMDWQASPLEDIAYRLGMAEKLWVEIERQRRRVTEGKGAGELFAALLWYTEVLSQLGHYGPEADALAEALELADRGGIALRIRDRIGLVTRLGIALHGTGEYRRAEPLFLEVMTLSGDHLGYEHPDTLSSVNNLASLYDSQGRYEEAEPLCQRALQGRERVLGPEHPDTLSSVSNLAILYVSQGRYKEAEPLYQRALQGYERVLGPEHPHTLVSVINLAGLYESQGRYEEAELLCQRALQGRERVLEPEHPDTLSSVNKLANIYQSQGRYEEAEPLCQRALQGYERVLGPEHPHTLVSVDNLAKLYKSQGRYEEAEPLCQRALQGCQRVLGPEHPHTLSSVNNLASLYVSQGRYKEAEPLYQRALQGYERVLGPEHPHTLVSINNLANLYESQGRCEDAEPLCQRALEGYERVLGLQHPDTLFSVNNLANLYRRQGRYEEAEPLYQRALEGYERVLGPEHPDTIFVRENWESFLRVRSQVSQENDPPPEAGVA